MSVFWFREPRFQKLPQDNESDSSTFENNYNPQKSRTPWFLLFLTSIFVVLIILLSFYIGRRWDTMFTTTQQLIPLESITSYSPILASLPLKYTSQIFNGSLLAPTIFRAPFGPEVDAAWDSLGVNYRPLAIPPRLAQKSGLTKDQVKINQKYGGGFPGNVEGLHHLHCLNLLRQTLWWNFNYYNEKGEGAFKNEPYILQMHTTHCLDIIRQQLMCQVDIGVLGQVWIHPEAPETYVDFNTKHQCRDFEAVRKWAEERQMPVEEELPGDWLEPPKMGDRVYEVIP